MKRIEGNINYTDEGNDLFPVAVDSVTATVILPGFDITTDILPVSVRIFHTGNKTLWVKTNGSNDKVGIPVMPGSGMVELFSPGAIFIGDLYAIYDNGPGGDVYITWI